MAISVFFRLGLGGPNEWWAKFFQYSLDPVTLVPAMRSFAPVDGVTSVALLVIPRFARGGT